MSGSLWCVSIIWWWMARSLWLVSIRVFLKGHFVKKKCSPHHVTGGYLERSYPEGETDQTSLGGRHWHLKFDKIGDGGGGGDRISGGSHGEKPTFQEAQLPTQTLLAGVSSGGPAVHLPLLTHPLCPLSTLFSAKQYIWWNFHCCHRRLSCRSLQVEILSGKIFFFFFKRS